MTDWLIEDEDERLEMIELYREAREQIDRAVPRGYQQVNWIWRKRDHAWIDRWLAAHVFWQGLARDLGVEL